MSFPFLVLYSLEFVVHLDTFTGLFLAVAPGCRKTYALFPRVAGRDSRNPHSCGIPGPRSRTLARDWHRKSRSALSFLFRPQGNARLNGRSARSCGMSGLVPEILLCNVWKYTRKCFVSMLAFKPFTTPMLGLPSASKRVKDGYSSGLQAKFHHR